MRWYAVGFLLIATQSSRLFVLKLQRKCEQPSWKFWVIYRNHFILTKTLDVVILQSDQHERHLRGFTEMALHTMHKDGQVNVTVRIVEKLLKYTNPGHRPYYSAPSIEHKEFTRTWNLTMEQILRLKRISSDYHQGYLIIVWNEEVLEKYLDQDYKAVFPNSRAIYIVFFVSTRSSNCEVSEKISTVMVRFWHQYNIVNILAFTPCSCKELVYSYWPFTRTKAESWGQIKIYAISQVSDHFGLILNPLWNFNGYPLPLSIFLRVPTALLKIPKKLKRNPIYTGSLTMAGIDGALLSTLSRFLNFQVLNTADANDSFGTVYPNGTITGSLGDVVHRRTQLSANGRFLVDYGTTDIEFTVPFSNDEICAVVPKSQQIPQWKMFLRGFDLGTWFALVALLLICCFFGAVNQISLWTIVSIYLGNPAKTRAVPRNKFFLGGVMIQNLIVTGIVTSFLFTWTSTISYYMDMRTLEDLDNSGLPIATSLQVFDYDNQSSIVKSLSKKKVYVNVSALDLIEGGARLATLQRKKDVNIFMLFSSINNGGTSQAHILDECVTSFFLAYIVPKGSPFLKIFNHVIARFTESGLPAKWYDDILSSISIETSRKVVITKRTHKPFELKDVQVAFYLLFLGSVLGVFSFLVEMVVSKNYTQTANENNVIK